MGLCVIIHWRSETGDLASCDVIGPFSCDEAAIDWACRHLAPDPAWDLCPIETPFTTRVLVPDNRQRQ